MQVLFIDGVFCLANNEGYHIGDIHYALGGQSEEVGTNHDNLELLIQS